MDIKESHFYDLMQMAGDLGITITSTQAHKLYEHLLLVLQKNKQINLTAIDTIDEGLILHTIDSLLFLPHLSDTDVFVDIGTGGGFPGIPLAICSGAQGVLIDSIQKKVHAVNSFIDELELTDMCSSLAIRAEELAVQRPNSFTCVVARAVAPTNMLLEYAAPLLQQYGKLVISKAKPEQTELEEAVRAADICGMEFVSRETFELPKDKGTRTISVYEKTTEPKIKLPRRPGVAKKKPLGRT